MEAWEADPLFADDAGASALQGLESYLFARLAPHQTLPTAEDRARDGALHFRAALLNAAGLSLADLGMPEDHAEAVQKMVKYGGFELLKIDMIGTPRLRVRAIVNFHKAAIDLISAFLAEGGGSLPSPRTSRAVAESLPLGGDVVLPALIWVILRVNPPHLPSNLAMLQRFRYAGFLTGEEGFAFTNLSAAITFLETADLTLFGVAPQLAERYPPRADPAAPPSPPPPPPAPAPEEPRGEATEGSGPPPPPALPFEPMQRDTASTRGNSWASSLLGSINR
ncbi:hypothetical protein DFJ74DRAFT_653952 [Hyaloraphidium curvatum]|nr:hypothetical protein DFJ74DRAFT_653952 [Hyaloraphidium curvatum]